MAVRPISARGRSTALPVSWTGGAGGDMPGRNCLSTVIPAHTQSTTETEKGTSTCAHSEMGRTGAAPHTHGTVGGGGDTHQQYYHNILSFSISFSS